MINTNYHYKYNQSFGAKAVSKAFILKRPEFCEPIQLEVPVITLDPQEKHDFRAIKKATEAWDKQEGGFFSLDILKDATLFAKKSYQGIRDNIYALTLQENRFEKPNPEQILCLSIVKGDSDLTYNKICWLQSNPLYNYWAEGKPLYHNIGKGFINFIRKFGNKPLELYTNECSEGFYKKLGFYFPFESSKTYMRLD